MKISFIGGGNMATAIIGGLIRSGFDAGDLQVVEIVAAAREQMARQGLRTYAGVGELDAAGDIVVLAVKPQQMRTAISSLIPKLGNQVILSIAAGIRCADLTRWLGGYERIVRCMPNTPALVGAGITGAYATPGITASERDAAQNVLATMGKTVWVANEALLDAVTAVSGSGPAYVFYFIEALREAGSQLGLDADAANTLAIETFVGAARLASQQVDDVARLRERVTSKGGTTEAALATMARDKVGDAIIRAVHAANARSRTLGDELGKDGSN